MERGVIDGDRQIAGQQFDFRHLLGSDPGDIDRLIERDAAYMGPARRLQRHDHFVSTGPIRIGWVFVPATYAIALLSLLRSEQKRILPKFMGAVEFLQAIDLPLLASLFEFGF